MSHVPNTVSTVGCKLLLFAYIKHERDKALLQYQPSVSVTTKSAPPEGDDRLKYRGDDEAIGTVTVLTAHCEFTGKRISVDKHGIHQSHTVKAPCIFLTVASSPSHGPIRPDGSPGTPTYQRTHNEIRPQQVSDLKRTLCILQRFTLLA
ncbi:hypothetical protein F2P81_019347 [Scophthalmus maximus]|uniref:Uncharacterized protein n=1 Tax=Scophthalmus maximus TaxID=52904 RepID=A0A6A4S9G0_SCOMX|nr:hypothetical protein F2P81_019347 [Scophthalmus maximus]